LAGGGTGLDWFARVAAGKTISWSEGSFPIVTGVTGETDDHYPGDPDVYSLQLNSNFFNGSNVAGNPPVFPPLCSGAANPTSCYGWQQFVYAHSLPPQNATGQVYIEYWLINYGNRCPSGWNTQGSSCWVNSGSATLPYQPIGNLPTLVVTGAAGSNDQVTMWTGDGNLYAVSQASVLSLNQAWSDSEFNVFGEGNSSNANINSGATIVVQTVTDTAIPSGAAPTGKQGSYTAEGSNLTVAGSYCPIAGPEPGIQFTESNPSGATPHACPPSASYATGASIAAFQQYGLNQTDVVSIDNNGQLNLVYTDYDAPWSERVAIGPAIFPAGAPVAASQQFGLAQSDVFAVDTSGNLEVAYVSGSDPWRGPIPIVTGGLFGQGSYIAASQQFGTSSPQTDVFIVDQYGAVTVSWVVGGGAWRSAEITARNLFPPGAPIAASQQYGLYQTDVFVVDNNGGLNVLWAAGGGQWHGPAVIGNSFTFPAGANVAAGQQSGLSQTDVFAVDINGNLYVASVSGTNPWAGPSPITSGGPFPMGAPLAVSGQVSSDSVDQIDVFIVNYDGDFTGNLTVMYAVGSNPWQGPARIGVSAPFPQYANLAASPQFGVYPPQIDVFGVDSLGYENVAWTQWTNPWNAPVEIP
jgi:hypothetical protein